MAFAKDSKERMMFADLYKLAEKYWDIPEDMINDETYWEGFFFDMQSFCRKFKDETDQYALRQAGLLMQRVRDISHKKEIICQLERDVFVESMIRQMGGA